jgi:2-polyprenyl-3-methyl-5-hydroxy-6-metoxy-1,4-benzoquinol methylase
MSLLVPPRRFDPAVPEMMDRLGNDPSLLRADLTVLERLNRHLGGHTIPVRYLSEFHATYVARNSDKLLRVLDLATGGGDVPRAIARKFNATITAVDGNPEIVQIARERSANHPDIHFEQQDLRALPYPPESFDVVLCSLTLHHFSEDDVVAILRRIHEIARVGYIVSDLRRNRVAIWLSQLMARTILTNPIAKFDAPASCERAFTVAELRALAERAGLEQFGIHRHRMFRMALVGYK